MAWAPTVTEELRNDVRFALRFKVGRKQQLVRPRARLGRGGDRRAHPAVQLARRARAVVWVCGIGDGRLASPSYDGRRGLDVQLNRRRWPTT
jgi:hypothetical protein